MGKLEAVEQVTNFFLEWSAPELTEFEAGYHTAMFLEKYLDLTKLGLRWGYTHADALRYQLLGYAEDVFGFEDSRIGE